MIRRGSTLQAVCFDSSALRKRGLNVVLVGGSAATYYSRGAYQSDDIDFVARFDVDSRREAEVVEVMTDLGYELNGNTFEHTGGNRFTVEFPKGPAAVSGDVLSVFHTVEANGKAMDIVTPTDCVRDRLAHYFFWNDRTALRAAIVVAQAHRSKVDMGLVKAWSAREGQSAKFKDFLVGLHAGRQQAKSRFPRRNPRPSGSTAARFKR